MSRLIAIFALSLLALCAQACQDPRDKEAKKRIFSAEDPPQAVANAHEKLPPEEAADTPRVTRRILEMGAAEATERIGPHRFTGTISWEWSATGKNLRLKETRELEAGKGGVSGDFAARLSNDHDQGIEVLRVGGQVFARSTWGKDGSGRFRQRLRDRGMAEKTREEAFGGVRDFDQLFRGRLKLAAQGTQSYQGRTAWKYTVSLAPPTAESDAHLPPPAFAKAGPDETTRRRLRFEELKSPRTLQGEVLVDSETSVVLKARLDGRLSVASDAGDAELRLVVDAAMSDVGKAPLLERPKDFLPDEDKPAGIAKALERFGQQTSRMDGGVRQAGEEVPDDAE